MSNDADQLRFNTEDADREKTEGMARAITPPRDAVLAGARIACIMAARQRITKKATADDAYKWMAEQGIGAKVLGNAAGSLFCGGNWLATNEWQKSERVSNHGRVVRVWKLVA